jgi:pimeloyl-ACP methyl ester carboxylesterase
MRGWSIIAKFTTGLGRVGAITNRMWFYFWKATSGKAQRGRFVEVNGVKIYYQTYGSGRPVLVMHGGAGFIEMMHHQIRALAANRFVIAPDSRAHGRSTDSDEPLSYALMANDMLKLLDELKIDEADIVGWSDGGIIGLDLAMNHPERVGRLVVIGANFDANGLVHKPIIDGKIPRTPRFYKRNAPDPAHWPALCGKLITMQQTQPHYSKDDLERIKAPTLVMVGEFDAIKREHTDQLAQAISGGQKEVIEGGTHAVLVEKPRLVNCRLLRFLDDKFP